MGKWIRAPAAWLRQTYENIIVTTQEETLSVEELSEDLDGPSTDDWTLFHITQLKVIPSSVSFRIDKSPQLQQCFPASHVSTGDRTQISINEKMHTRLLVRK